jgi:hypothetical protein
MAQPVNKVKKNGRDPFKGGKGNMTHKKLSGPVKGKRGKSNRSKNGGITEATR